MDQTSSPLTSLTETQIENQLSSLFLQAPIGLALVKGDSHMIELANKEFLRLTGRNTDIIGKPITETFTEFESQGFLALLNDVLKNKKTIHLDENPAVILINGVRETLFINTVLQPYFEGKEAVGVLSILTDVTEQVLSRKKVEENEERLRLAVESSRLGTYEFDIMNSSLIFSPRLVEIVGLDPAKERTHQDLIKVLHPDDVHIRDEAHEKANKSGSLFYEVRVVWPDDSVHWIRLNGRVVFDKNGNPSKTYGTVLDITEQKETERILKESEDKMRIITDAVPHMVWEIELDGTISYINKQWEDWSGLSLEEINRGGWSKVFHPEDGERVAIGWGEAFTNKNIYVGECRIKNPQGGYSWFTLKTVPVKNNKGEVELWIGTATDIHEKKIAEQQKDEFLSIASHELKTPVTSLKGFTQILQMRFEKEGNEAAADLLSKMDKQVDKLTKLIVDLLDATKIENGQLILSNEEFDFNELVTEVVEEMQRTTENQKIITKLSVTKIINGDRNRISQVITNLISNAIKYSPNKTEIIVSTANEKNNIKLCVQDFGIGISSSTQSKIFDRFFRVSGKNQDTYPGLGLGLFISSEIIKRHKGEIMLQSAEGEGSTFCFTLPIKK